MPDLKTSFRTFVNYVATLKGDEKGEAQVLCDRFFQALGYAGYKEAGATLEERVKKDKATKFADLVWPGRLLIEMKKRGEKLEKHYRQAFEYWMYIVPNRPRYVALCNFDEFWIYDFNQQVHEPMDRVAVVDLPERYDVFNSLLPEPKDPVFNNNRVDVTRKAANLVARVFKSFKGRGIPAPKAQRFILQCVVALFAEDIELLPHSLFTELLNDCASKGASSFDLIGGLFRQMNQSERAEGGRFKKVDYFNGGLFAVVEPVEMNKQELADLREASAEKWSVVKPEIFGTLFEQSMEEEDRHAFGAHFTSEADIQKVVLPTIVRPWRKLIESANTAKDLMELRSRLTRFRVLDPACGSGNFLYIAYRELKRLETEIIRKIHDNFGQRIREKVGRTSHVSAANFFGFDIIPFAVELAKVTLMIGKKLALDETTAALGPGQTEIQFDLAEDALPLDNLDTNIVCKDALFTPWPEVEAITGNPPYLDARKVTLKHGDGYVSSIRGAFPDVPGRADLCVYWFRKTHDHLKPGARAGLVGTNTVRQNYSREGGLDYIVRNGGTITDAVSTQVWSGDAQVHVSIVNWVKGDESGAKKLMLQRGDSVESPWETYTLDRINSALSTGFDVSGAASLDANARSTGCFEGQQPGHDGFRLTASEAAALASRQCGDVIRPYLNGTEMLGGVYLTAPRFIIDFGERNKFEAEKYAAALDVLRTKVLPDWTKNAEAEKVKSGRDTGEHQNRLRKWWQLKRQRKAMIAAIEKLPRYAVCVRHTKRPIFEFLDSKIRPDSSFTVFPLADDYSFGILQSGIHWEWFLARCSTIKADFRYTSDTVFDSFPWPQSPTLPHVKAIAKAAVELRSLRRKVMADNSWSRRELYRSLEEPGDNPLDELHDKLDTAVRAAYGMKARQEPLEFLFNLNKRLAGLEADGKAIIGPGTPPCVEDAAPFITEDRVAAPTY